MKHEEINFQGNLVNHQGSLYVTVPKKIVEHLNMGAGEVWEFKVVRAIIKTSRK